MNANELFHQLQLQIWDITWNRYLTEELFSARWWGVLIFLLAIYALWLKLLNKSRALEIVLFGSFVAVQAVMVDIAGFSMGLWQHNLRLLPVVPGVFPIDFTVVPILLMVAHQYGLTWSQYLTWSALAALLFSFGISPAFQYFGIKAYYNWHFAYFVVLMMAVAVTSRLTIELVVRTVQTHPRDVSPSPGLSPLPQPAAKHLPDDDNNRPDPRK
ncbi:MAG: CBO0543 family protein [Sporomusaceae bacterium]|nr:CBO0543 family protein [Sporomusaceae bacterium]